MKLVSQFPTDKRDAVVATAAVVTVSLLISYLSKRSDKEKRKMAHVPASTLPILGNMLDMTANMPRFHDWISEQCAAFNNEPWTLQIPGKEPWIVLSSAELFEDVLKTQADNFLRGPVSQHQAYDVLGNGLSTADGDVWFYHRKTSSHLFSMQMMRTVMEDTVREKLDVFLDVLGRYSVRGKPFGIKKELSHFTMDVFSKIGFGVELDTLKNTFESEEDHEFLEAFNVASVAFGVRIQMPTWLWELKKYFNIGWEKVLMDSCKKFHDFIDSFIVKAIQAKNEKKEARDLISLFLESKIDIGDLDIKEDEAQIMRDMAITFIFAGKDSVAHSIGWFIVNMNRYPEILRRVREEMLQKLPGLFSGQIQVPTNAQLQDLVYLDAVIRENIRLHPSTGFIMRQAVEATTLVDGTFVDKEVSVLLPSYANARNPRTWGDDPHEFKPERFIDSETGKLRNFSPFVFSSFGSGPHICLGQKFALMELKLSLATLFSKFDVKTVENPWEMTYEFSLTIPVKGPMDVLVTPFTVTADSA
ncbi:Cytochrome P450 86A8 [Phytophthora citrophthora]|uniref:Cytochrome P450 86A8 n=1 Tax=Phytophthora citrophthora TaxID=4793 RepID=A0AAD9GKA3_9STRA|nr:Cytochrome P450 86A8 [Phytophthora citrophthora]